MSKVHLRGLLFLAICGMIPAIWGFAFLHATLSDFEAVYYGSRCLLEGHDPYLAGASLRIYYEHGGAPLDPTDPTYQILNRQAYLPIAFLCAAPFAMLPWGPAHVLWTVLSQALLITAAFLVWSMARRHAPRLSLLLIGFMLANGQILFSSGNAAAMAVGLCGIAVWCFLNDRFVFAGIVCLAISLALKPHDTGFIWLFFLLIAGAQRKRALQTVALVAVLAVPALLWASHTAPHWVPELRSDLAVYDAPQGLNNPGPHAYTSKGPAMVIDLQAAISILRDDPRVYNPASYLICAMFLVAWIVAVFRKKYSLSHAWFAIAAVAPLTMLPVYHRPYDAKLLMLTVPACALLWSRSRRLGLVALLLNALTIVVTCDIPLAILLIINDALHISVDTGAGKVLTILFLRPAPLILLSLSIFYLWALWRLPQQLEENQPASTADLKRASLV